MSRLSVRSAGIVLLAFLLLAGTAFGPPLSAADEVTLPIIITDTYEINQNGTYNITGHIYISIAANVTEVTLTQSNPAIPVTASVVANNSEALVLTMNGINIQTGLISGSGPESEPRFVPGMDIAGAEVTLQLKGDNSITGNMLVMAPAVRVPAGKSLKITGTDADSLTVIGGAGSAGIGGGDNEAGGTTTITGGVVTAIGGLGGAGIGGGDQGAGGTTTITGGVVTATCGLGGAGIGGGAQAAGGTTTIAGGHVTATGNSGGAGIGGGGQGASGATTITDGVVTATGGLGGAGIGGGDNKAGGTTTITGGDVTANGGQGAAGIGGGDQGAGGATTITGGDVTATGGLNAAGIGGGSDFLGAEINGGETTITGGNVTATGGTGGAGIGGGLRGAGGTTTISGGTIVASDGGDVGPLFTGAVGIGKGAGGGSTGTTAIDGGSIRASGDTSAFQNSAGTSVYLLELTVKEQVADDHQTILPFATLSYKDGEVSTDEDGKLYLYVPVGGYSLEGLELAFPEGYRPLALTPMPLAVSNEGAVAELMLSNLYQIEWALNGGTMEQESVTKVEYGESVDKPSPDPQRSGYTFDGWYNDPNGTNQAAFPAEVRTDTTFYAQWRANPLTLSEADLPNGDYGETYNADLPAAENGTGNYTYAITDGQLPDGLALNGRVISGIAGKAGSYTFEVTAKDSDSGSSVSQTYTIVIVGPGLTVPADGLYGMNETLRFMLAYDDEVIVSGTPSVPLTIGTGSVTKSVYAVYTGESGVPLTSLSFAYEVPAGMADEDGIAVAPQLALPDGASIKRVSSGANASRLYEVPDMSGIRIVAIAPELALQAAPDGPQKQKTVSVTASVYGATAGNRLTKLSWMAGSHSAADFTGEAGIDLMVGQQFTVDANGVYTVYAKDAAGNEAVKEIEIANIATASPEPDDDDDDSPSSGGHASGQGNSNAKVISTNGKLTLPASRAGEVSLGKAVTIIIPAGASDQQLTLTIQEVSDAQQFLTDGDVLASPIYEILKNVSQNFIKPVTLIFAFDPSVLKANQVPVVRYYDEAKKEWTEIAGGKIEGNRIAVEVDHFTKFAVFAVDQAPTAPVQDPATFEISFSDIAGHWAEAGIKQAVFDGIITGYPDGTFKPDDPVTRAEFTVMLAGALKLDGTGAALPFNDRGKIGAWAERAVALAVQAGIVGGYEDGGFRPDARITRAEMAVMIARALRVSLDANAQTGFADDEDIPPWAKGAVEAIRKLGIVSGRGGNNFVPNDTATRSEAVVMLLRMSEHSR